MAFVEVVSKRSKRISTDQVTLAAHNNKSGGPRLSLWLSVAVLELLRWEVGSTRVAVLEGTGLDIGILKIVPREPTGRQVCAYDPEGNGITAGSGQITCPASDLYHHMLVRDAHPAVAVEYNVFARELTLQAPAWIVKREPPASSLEPVPGKPVLVPPVRSIAAKLQAPQFPGLAANGTGTP